MVLLKKIEEDYIVALKARETLRVSVLRMLRAELKNREKDKRTALDEQEIVGAVRFMIKKRQEAADAFRQGGAREKAEQELAENEILKAYLPAELDEAEQDRLIAEAIEEVGARGPGDLGKVMKIVVPKVAGRADGKTVNQKVRQALS
ncbi:MAG TPA: GatB/YqeY domain-containing protein [bacterium]|nr:GatB/YqeY domain-containing protein [bacterium]